MKKLRYAIQKSTKIKLERTLLLLLLLHKTVMQYDGIVPLNVIIIIFFDPGTKFPRNEKNYGIVPLNQNGESLK